MTNWDRAEGTDINIVKIYSFRESENVLHSMRSFKVYKYYKYAVSFLLRNSFDGLIDTDLCERTKLYNDH
jgi:hypothetical protein